MESDWTILPKHIFDSILEKLESSKDFLRFDSVCISWHSIVKDNQNKHIKMQRCHQVPQLFIPCEEDKHIWTIYDVMDNNFLDLKITMPYDRRFCASSEGWLVAVNKDYTVSLYNPYSMLVGNCNTYNIQLPRLFPPQPFLLPGDEYDFENVSEDESEEDYDYHIFKATITADPLENPADCTIAVIFFGDTLNVAFIRLGKDTTWTKIDWGHLFDDILPYNNHFYALDNFGRLISFDDDPHNLNVNLVTSENVRTRVTYSKRYLVKSCRGDILQLERYLTWGDNNGRHITTKFNVFKLDLERQRWSEIKDLGDESLFLGDNSSISISSSNFVSYKRNCIYFTHDADLVRSDVDGFIDMGIYNIETEIFTPHFNIDSSTFTKMSRRAPIWIVPTINSY